MVHEINDVGLTLFYIYFPPTRMLLHLTCPMNLACQLALARPTDLGRELKENQKGPRMDTKVPPLFLAYRRSRDDCPGPHCDARPFFCPMSGDRCVRRWCVVAVLRIYAILVRYALKMGFARPTCFVIK